MDTFLHCRPISVSKVANVSSWHKGILSRPALYRFPPKTLHLRPLSVRMWLRTQPWWLHCLFDWCTSKVFAFLILIVMVMLKSGTHFHLAFNLFQIFQRQNIYTGRGFCSSFYFLEERTYTSTAKSSDECEKVMGNVSQCISCLFCCAKYKTKAVWWEKRLVWHAVRDVVSHGVDAVEAGAEHIAPPVRKLSEMDATWVAFSFKWSGNTHWWSAAVHPLHLPCVGVPWWV